jgi:Protein of unknown function (DUF2905)
MMPLSGMGKLLIGLGCLLVIIGVAFLLVGKIPWFGRLPGDIYVERPNFTFFFPLTTSILISAILSLTWYLLSRR